MLKRIKPETYTLLGILVLFAVGSLFHFLYSLTGECFIIGLFVPINESIFEHTKMVVLPVFIWWFIFYLFRKKDLFVNAWFTSALIAMISAIIAIPMLFYFYSQAFGIESLIIDILILLASFSNWSNSWFTLLPSWKRNRISLCDIFNDCNNYSLCIFYNKSTSIPYF